MTKPHGTKQTSQRPQSKNMYFNEALQRVYNKFFEPNEKKPAKNKDHFKQHSNKAVPDMVVYEIRLAQHNGEKKRVVRARYTDISFYSFENIWNGNSYANISHLTKPH